MQVDSDVLSLHRGLPCRGFGVETPSIAMARIPRGAEAPPLHHISSERPGRASPTPSGPERGSPTRMASQARSGRDVTLVA